MIDLLSAALVPIIAVITTCIAYQQWKVNKTRLNLDLYDRRLSLFKAVEEFHNSVGIDGSINYSLALKLRTTTAEARFLFGKDIVSHLDELYRESLRAASLRERLYPKSGEGGLPVGDERSRVVDEEGELIKYFLTEAHEETKKLFGKYLTLA